MPKSYSPKIKIQVVKEALRTEKSKAQIAREYDIHPNTVHKWIKIFERKGEEIFKNGKSEKENERKIAEYERLLGQKEREIAILKNFLGNLN